MKKKLKKRARKISSKKKRVKKRKVSKKRKKLKKTRKIKRKVKKARKIKGKIKRKIRLKLKIKLPKIQLKTPKFNLFKKISFQKMVNWLLEPIFRGWDSYLERKRRMKIARMEFERKERIRQKKEESKLRLEAKKKELQREKKIAIERKKDLSKFISESQALLRREQAEEKRRVYEAMKVQRKLDLFAAREKKEIAFLEKFALREQISEYKEIESKILQIKQKYAALKEARVRASYEEMGIDVQESDTREDLFEKHRIFEEQRKRVEQVLESFWRSSTSLIFQLNRNWIPKNLEILRVIDKRWEENLFYIRFDNEIEDNFLQMIYLLDGKTDQAVIVVEDKTSEKFITKKFNTSSIFEFSDWMVDRWTQFLDREFKKKKAS